MTDKLELTPKQNHIVDLINQMILVNPFSPEADSLSREMTGRTEPLSPVELTGIYVQKLDDFFLPLDKKLGRKVRIDDFKQECQEKIYYLICYYFFRKYSDQMDELVNNQLKSPYKSVPVPFADKLISEMGSRGIDMREAVRVFSYYYQLRRAWLFISTRLIGQGPSMERMRQDLWNNIFTHSVEIYEKKLWYRMEDFSTLLLGPTGSGKGAAAQAIGFSSYIPYDVSKKQFDVSFMQNFVPVNLSQFPETLLESELFGHSRGAFTGATEDYDGLFARCGQYGTIFLDEIAEIELHTQVKLLRVLEERRFRALGSHKESIFQGRVIAATHQPIAELCANGRFRDDLYYRLCSDVIYVPSLRQRLDESPQELELMVRHLLERMVGSEDHELCEMICRQLSKELPGNYQWPGNVRELAQLIRRIIIKKHCGAESGKYGGLADCRNIGQSNAGPISQPAIECTITEMTEQYCRGLYQKYGNYQDVARISGLNWRTVKKYCEQ